MLTLGLKAGGPPQSKPKLPVVAVWNDSAGKALCSSQPPKVRLNFRIECDFSTGALIMISSRETTGAF